jgi:hypothetical protein
MSLITPMLDHWEGLPSALETLYGRQKMEFVIENAGFLQNAVNSVILDVFLIWLTMTAIGSYTFYKFLMWYKERKR